MLPLIRDAWNFTRFSVRNVLPTGCDQIFLVACGRLTGSGHAMKYSGLRVVINEIVGGAD
jgi:hypothetical protein